MDPDLDYEVDSDDEWEEVIGDFAPLFSFFVARGTHVVFSQEDPGESLSDCEKDNDDIMEEDSKITDDEGEDSFVVPDGYLSDNEVSH